MPVSLARDYLHIVFSTKGREPFLADPAIRGAMHSFLSTACRDLGSPSLRVGGVEDHVHVLCLLGRTLAISDLIREMKRRTSKCIKADSGLRRFYWQSGFGAFSVSPTHVDRVEAYIASQEEHHRRVGFQSELRRLLKKNRVEYDESTVWD